MHTVDTESRVSEADSQFSAKDPLLVETPPRVLGKSIFNISAKIVDSDSVIPNDLRVIPVKVGKEQRRFLRRKRDKNTELPPSEGGKVRTVKDVLAALSPEDVGFKVGVRGYGGKFEGTTFYTDLVENEQGIATVHSADGRSRRVKLRRGDRFVFPTVGERPRGSRFGHSSQPQEIFVANKARGDTSRRAA